VKLTIGLKLKPTEEQAKTLRKTLERANAAANECSRLAWENKTFGQYKLHKLAYQMLREKYGLSAQLAVRIIAKVADAYKLDQRRQRVFRKDGSIAFDDRILRYGLSYVTIWTVNGREQIPFVCGAHQQRLLHSRQGESDLVYRKGKWYLFATCNVIEPVADDPDGFLGVDFGIARLATDSDGQSYSGAHTRNLRKRHRRLRAKLQSKGTKSAKRLLKKRKLQERRFATDTNHCISKRLVEKAKHTKRAMVLENLKGIRSRIRVSKAQRAELHSWSFHQLRSFVEYKARLVGVRLIPVDPRNSSRECSRCGHISQSNRPARSIFSCRQCGHATNADLNAASVLKNRGRAVCQPATRGVASQPQVSPL
jgi:IS605 OrfB family transposase